MQMVAMRMQTGSCEHAQFDATTTAGVRISIAQLSNGPGNIRTNLRLDIAMLDVVAFIISVTLSVGNWSM